MMRRILVSVAMGTIGSIALAVLGPRYLPQRWEERFTKGGDSLRPSWLAVEYFGSGRDAGPTIDTVVHEARRSEFTSTLEDEQLREMSSDGDGVAGSSFARLLESGFPFRSARACEVRPSPMWAAHQPGGRPAPVTMGVYQVGPWEYHPHAGWLPTSPIWPGLVGNVIVWSAAVWLPLAGFSATRRRLRARGNRCPKCNYDLRGLPEGSPCPECGQERMAAAGGEIGA